MIYTLIQGHSIFFYVSFFIIFFKNLKNINLFITFM